MPVKAQKKSISNKWKVKIICHPFPNDFARELAYREWVKVCVGARAHREVLRVSVKEGGRREMKKEEGIIPVLHFALRQRMKTKKIRKSLSAIEEICNQEDALISKLAEFRYEGEWYTGIRIRSKVGFEDEEKAKYWWSATSQHLQRELPYPKLIPPLSSEDEICSVCCSKELLVATAEAPDQPFASLL